MDASQTGSSKAAQMIWIVGSPVIFTIGVVGNIITIIVLIKKKNRNTSTAVYLILMAWADLLTITTLLPRWWIIYMFGYDIRQSSNIMCKLHWFMVYFFPALSAAALCSVTLERVISTLKPHKVRILCSTKSALGISVTVTLCVFCFMVHLVYGFSLEANVENEPLGNNTQNNISSNYTSILLQNTSIDAKPKKTYICLWTHDKAYSWFYSNVFIWLRLAIYHFSVQAVFIIGGIIIIRVIARSKKLHKIHESSVGQPVNRYNRNTVKGRSQSTQITITLLSVNAAYFLLSTPAIIFLLGKPSWIGIDTSMNELQEILWAIFNLLYYFNHSINFLLYFLSGRKFRADVMELFRCCKGSVPDQEVSVNNALSISRNVHMMYNSFVSGNELTGGTSLYTE